MAEQPPPEEGRISNADAYRLKHHFNTQVTYGHSGLNALQVRQLLNQRADWKKLWQEYDDYYVKQVGSRFARKVGFVAALAVACLLF